MWGSSKVTKVAIGVLTLERILANGPEHWRETDKASRRLL